MQTKIWYDQDTNSIMLCVTDGDCRLGYANIENKPPKAEGWADVSDVPDAEPALSMLRKAIEIAKANPPETRRADAVGV